MQSYVLPTVIKKPHDDALCLGALNERLGKLSKKILNKVNSRESYLSEIEDIHIAIEDLCTLNNISIHRM